MVVVWGLIQLDGSAMSKDRSSLRIVRADEKRERTRSSGRVERGQSVTPGVWAERVSGDVYRVRWTEKVGLYGVGGSTSSVTNPATGEAASLREAKYRGEKPAAVRARAQACEWVYADLAKRRKLRRDGETIASRSVDSLARLCDSRDAVDVNPRLVGLVLAHALALPDPTGHSKLPACLHQARQRMVTAVKLRTDTDAARTTDWGAFHSCAAPRVM
jgi:hypothetical protein